MTPKKTTDNTAAARAPRPKQAGESLSSPTAKTAAAAPTTPKPAKAAKSAPSKAPARKVSAPRTKAATAAKPRPTPPVVVAIEAVPSPPPVPSRDRIAARAAEICARDGGRPVRQLDPGRARTRSLTGGTDTPPEIEAIQVQLHREMGSHGRRAAAMELNQEATADAAGDSGRIQSQIPPLSSRSTATNDRPVRKTGMKRSSLRSTRVTEAQRTTASTCTRWP